VAVGVIDQREENMRCQLSRCLGDERASLPCLEDNCVGSLVPRRFPVSPQVEREKEKGLQPRSLQISRSVICQTSDDASDWIDLDC
jgi:hypothetical protein